jgi:phosphoribosylformylglycinamidine synthase subunit PurQ / glutaminase
MRARRAGSGVEGDVVVSRPVALIVHAPGTNRDHDVAFALDLAGAEPMRMSMAALRANPAALHRAQLTVFAGGFSHADALGAGAVWGLDVARSLGDELRRFVADGKPVLGICNGFQTLVRAGLLPGSLTHNRDGGFVCTWVRLEPVVSTRCMWTQAVDEPIECPVAHGEGRYMASDEVAARHAALRYTTDTDPNGSVAHTAGVTDATGLVLGLMPHPENHVLARQHPRWARGEQRGLGLSLFESGVRHAKERG